MHYFVGVIIDEPNEDKVFEALERHEGRRWDWWVTGGRYDGIIKGIQANSKDNGFNFGDDHHKIENNIIKVSDYLAMRNKDKLTRAINKMLSRETFFLPCAVVLPSGIWKEDDYPYSVTNNAEKEKIIESSRNRMIRRLNRYKDYYIVGIDCHN